MDINRIVANLLMIVAALMLGCLVGCAATLAVYSTCFTYR